jgi:putative transposase
MARPLRIQYPGAFYHITCRGNERRKIFLDDDDRYRFVKLLKESLKIYQVVVYAYVLMDNHFHLVAQTLRANASEFMRRFNICYTSWFHYRHNTCGHLYQGRYKALLVDADNYLLELSRYVHLNPVRVGRVCRGALHKKWQYVMKYQWSSLAGYVNAKRAVDFVKYDLVLDMVGGRRAYQRFLLDGAKKGLDDIYEDVQYQTILGNDDFVALVKGEYLKQGSLHEQPPYRNLVAKTIKPERVIACCAEALGTEANQLKVRSGDGTIRGIVADMLYQYSGITHRAIGELLGGIGYTAVNMLRTRLRKKIQDPTINALYTSVDHRLHQICEL